MRPGQNGKRTRRGRKPHNFSNRTFDSNGPDVKIRGTAAHIFEKYQALARDANASGDRIGAENYLQHAEHYYRIMATFQQNGQGGQQPFNGQRPNMAPGEGPQPQMGRPGMDDPDPEEGAGADGMDEAEEAEDVRA